MESESLRYSLSVAASERVSFNFRICVVPLRVYIYILIILYMYIVNPALNPDEMRGWKFFARGTLFQFVVPAT